MDAVGVAILVLTCLIVVLALGWVIHWRVLASRIGDLSVALCEAERESVRLRRYIADAAAKVNLEALSDAQALDEFNRRRDPGAANNSGG